MRLMIASDLHGSARWTRALLTAFGREGADRLLLLGDLLYHGPRNDLPEGYDPRETAAMLNTLKARIFCVRGNCEAEVDQLMLDFPVMAEYCLLPLAGALLFATHGHRWHLEALPPLMPGDLLLHGHTHVPSWTPFGAGSFCLNPGSVSIPKEGSPRSYMTLENGCFRWKTLDGECYHSLEREEWRTCNLI